MQIKANRRNLTAKNAKIKNMIQVKPILFYENALSLRGHFDYRNDLEQVLQKLYHKTSAGRFILCVFCALYG
jgi:hypothetical protein